MQCMYGCGWWCNGAFIGIHWGKYSLASTKPAGDCVAASDPLVRFPNPLATGSDIHGSWGTWLVVHSLSPVLSRRLVEIGKDSTPFWLLVFWHCGNAMHRGEFQFILVVDSSVATQVHCSASYHQSPKASGLGNLTRYQRLQGLWPARSKTPTKYWFRFLTSHSDAQFCARCSLLHCTALWSATGWVDYLFSAK